MSPTLVLRAELDNDPLGRGYSTMTDNQVIESINEPNRPAPLRPIPSAELLGCTTRAVYNLMNEGKLKTFKHGPKRRVPTTELLDYINRQIAAAN